MCTMAGTGILQLPLTLKQGGWVCLGLIVLVGQWHALINCYGRHRRPVTRSTPQASGTLQGTVMDGTAGQ